MSVKTRLIIFLTSCVLNLAVVTVLALNHIHVGFLGGAILGTAGYFLIYWLFSLKKKAE